MKTIIAGSRSIQSREQVFEVIQEAMNNGFKIDQVVSGAAEGVDSIGEEWAEQNDVGIQRFPYEEYLDENRPKVAPLVRNRKMAEYADQAIIIWDGKSKGTEDMISKAEDEDLDIHIERTDIRNIEDF